MSKRAEKEAHAAQADPAGVITASWNDTSASIPDALRDLIDRASQIGLPLDPDFTIPDEHRHSIVSVLHGEGNP